MTPITRRTLRAGPLRTRALRTRARRVAATVALAAGLVAGGCGIPADDGPRDISQDQLPATSTPVDVGAEGQALAVDLWFTRFDGSRDVLTTVSEEVPTGGESGQPTPATVLDALLSGVPDEPGNDPSVVTKIPANTALASQPVLRSGILTIDLDRGISGVQGDGARLAYGQMVCTTDALDGVDGVLFSIDGAPVQPPNGQGETGGAPLTCAAYDNVAAG